MTSGPAHTIEYLRCRLAYDPATGIFTWKVPPRGKRVGDRAGTQKTEGYRRVQVDGHFYYEQRLAWALTRGEWPAEQMDHRGRSRADNRLDHLRPASNQQNSRNGSARPGTSTFKGVSFFARDERWRAYIVVDGKQLHLGYFDREDDAALAYDVAARQHFGEFAALNFPSTESIAA